MIVKKHGIVQRLDQLGCDIHTYKEFKINGEWVTGDTWREYYGFSEPVEEIYDGRNYHLFGLLAGVRAYRYAYDPIHPVLEPKGLPDDICKEVKQANKERDEDWHSHSWLTISEIKALPWFKWTVWREYHDSEGYFNGHLDFIRRILAFEKEAQQRGLSGDEARMVFWFDN